MVVELRINGTTKLAARVVTAMPVRKHIIISSRSTLPPEKMTGSILRLLWHSRFGRRNRTHQVDKMSGVQTKFERFQIRNEFGTPRNEDFSIHCPRVKRVYPGCPMLS